MATFHSNNSFLKNTQVTKFYLDVNTLPKIPQSASDELYTIESRYDKRPDLLANDLFGTVKLWWVFALRNPDKLIDPLEDFTSGKEIFLPRICLQKSIREELLNLEKARAVLAEKNLRSPSSNYLNNFSIFAHIINFLLLILFQLILL